MCSGRLSPRLCATSPFFVGRSPVSDSPSFQISRAEQNTHPRVDEPELGLGLLLAHALQLKVARDRLGDALHGIKRGEQSVKFAHHLFESKQKRGRTTPDEPAPKKRIFWSLSGTPFRWKARIAPARTTAPVPWMSSTMAGGQFLTLSAANASAKSKRGLTVEARVHVAVLLQEGESERGVEVFELDDLRDDAKSVQGSTRQEIDSRRYRERERRQSNSEKRTMLGNVACISFMNTSTNSSHLSSGRRRCLMPRSVRRDQKTSGLRQELFPRVETGLTKRVGEKLLVVRTKVERDRKGLYSRSKEG